VPQAARAARHESLHSPNVARRTDYLTEEEDRSNRTRPLSDGSFPEVFFRRFLSVIQKSLQAVFLCFTLLSAEGLCFVLVSTVKPHTSGLL